MAQCTAVEGRDRGFHQNHMKVRHKKINMCTCTLKEWGLCLFVFVFVFFGGGGEGWDWEVGKNE